MTRRVPSPQDFLATIQGPRRKTSASRPIRLASVDPAYDAFTSWPDAAPAARVTFEGETVLSTKAYPITDGFIPRAGQRVWLVPVGNSYLISGSIEGPSSQGFWQDPDGALVGVELGGGSYFDTDEGLVLAHDAAVAGALTAGPRDIRVPEIQRGRASITAISSASSQSQAVTFPVAYPVGTVPQVFLNIATTGAGSLSLDARAVSASDTGFTITIVKSDAVLANFVLSALPVDWMAVATP